MQADTSKPNGVTHQIALDRNEWLRLQIISILQVGLRQLYLFQNMAMMISCDGLFQKGQNMYETASHTQITHELVKELHNFCVTILHDDHKET